MTTKKRLFLESPNIEYTYTLASSLRVVNAYYYVFSIFYMNS